MKKYILGVYFNPYYTSHDAGVAILDKQGNIVFAMNEERLSRIKYDSSFPEKSIKEALKYTDIKIEEIRYVVRTGIDNKTIVTRCEELFRERNKRFNARPSKEGIRKKMALIEDKIRFENSLDSKLQKYFPDSKIYRIDHHLSHAASTYYTCPWRDATIITIDGYGNMLTSIIAKAEEGKINIINETLIPHSLGIFWYLVTRACFEDRGKRKIHSNEGKVTSLAAKGNPIRLIRKFREYIKCKGLKIEMSGHFDHGQKREISVYTKHLLNVEHFFKILHKSSREDIAAAAQKRLEEVVLKLINNAISKTGNKKLAVAGGVFANVLLNKKINESSMVKDFYVFPAMSDSGLALGSALYLFHLHQQRNKRDVGYKPKALKSVFLGPKYHINEIEHYLQKNKIKYKKMIDAPKEIAEKIHNGKIIGLFSDRMEYGPRALGNRSIICSAANKSIKDVLNKRLKRSGFMPFSPVTIDKYASRCYKNYQSNQLSSRYMTLAYNCTKRMKKDSPACVHIDGTARPQIIHKKDNPYFYNILLEYYKISGIPSLLNTSFNMHGEPIVCSYKDALRSFLHAELDYLVIETFICDIKDNKHVKREEMQNLIS